MGNLKTVEDLIDNPKVQKYIDAIDSDAQDAIDTADSVIKSPLGKLYSSSTLSAYKADRKLLDDCWGDFNAAWNKVVFKKAKDNKEIIKTYTKYVLALEILEQANTIHGAMLASGFAALAAKLIEMLIAFAENMQKACKELEAELKAMEARLKKAKREVVEAGAQAALNVALTAVTFCMGPVGWGARIGLAIGSIGAHMVIDGALGPSSGSALGTVNTVAGDGVSLVDKLSKGSKSLVSGAGAVITLKMDTDEIGDAMDIVEGLQKDLKALVKKYESVTASAAKWKKDITGLKTKHDAALKAYESAANSYRSGTRKREELLKEFKAWK